MDCIIKICVVGKRVFHCFDLISGRFLRFGPLITAATNHRDRRALLQLTARTSTKHRCGLVASTWPLRTMTGMTNRYTNIMRSYVKSPNLKANPFDFLVTRFCYFLDKTIMSFFASYEIQTKVALKL